MVTTQPGKPLSRTKRTAGLALIAATAAAGMFFGLWVTGFFRAESPPDFPPESPGSPAVLAIFLLVLGGATLVAGICGYFLVLHTHCFTFDFSRPVFAAFKPRLYLANIAVTLLLAGGVALCLAAVLSPLLIAAGMSADMAILVAGLGIFLPLQLVTVWVSIWAPLERKFIARRLEALGILPSQMQAAVCLGISDPAKSSFKKLTMVEDDWGMLWFTPLRLIYRGDRDQFDFTRAQLLEIERVADSGSMTAYAGGVHVVLRFQQADGSERRVRLHGEGNWTLSAAARAHDALAERIARWQEEDNMTLPATIVADVQA